jgi:hypothetical protein
MTHQNRETRGISTFLGRGAVGEQSEPAEQPDRAQVQQSEQQGTRSCHDQAGSPKPQVTMCDEFWHGTWTCRSGGCWSVGPGRAPASRYRGERGDSASACHFLTAPVERSIDAPEVWSIKQSACLRLIVWSLRRRWCARAWPVWEVVGSRRRAPWPGDTMYAL